MIDLHELVNMPGAGRAKDVLVGASCWNEKEDQKPSLYRGEGQEEMAFRRNLSKEGK